MARCEAILGYVAIASLECEAHFPEMHRSRTPACNTASWNTEPV